MNGHTADSVLSLNCLKKCVELKSFGEGRLGIERQSEVYKHPPRPVAPEHDLQMDLEAPFLTALEAFQKMPPGTSAGSA